MAGSTRAPPAAGARGVRRGPRLCRYLAVDGGSGAHLLARLAAADPFLRRVHSARHADLLLIIGPVPPALGPSTAELARALPHPARGVLLAQAESDALPDFLAGVPRVLPSVEAIVDAIPLLEHAENWPGTELPSAEPTTVPLPPKGEREVATEPVVLSLGPIQPLTAGPLRLLLVCDGEQVDAVRVEDGYARRAIDETVAASRWSDAAQRAADLDPLAPVAGRLAFVRAVERLRGWRASEAVRRSREAALATERAESHLWWLARFAAFLALEPLAERARRLASALVDARSAPVPAAEWLFPQGGIAPIPAGGPAILQRIAEEAELMRERLERDRWLGLRTRGVGVLPAARAKEAGASGPVLAASTDGAGDVHARLVARLRSTVRDLRHAAAGLPSTEAPAENRACWDVPAGDAHASAEGPRGRIGLRLMSEGGEGPARVEWERPSAALLRLLPDMLRGQKLADAEVIVASLDLSMAEADG